ncbi:F-box associated interaction domain-containing protein [Artemisia annua]|uniref:F-box associated interaction domain-containing protein n=1 Tax=Artemisia annua TaxID=35608 RepID=A0A2U1Q6X7_ARTAN|nr:F-box associated interaction domain-containing protein [Artemisia annua]
MAEQKSNASFPPDIIREILLKLPVESLLRCKSVCKEWYSLISDQHFIKSHYSLSSTNINYAHHRLICNTRSNLISCPLYDVLFNEYVNNAIQLENPLQRTWPRRVRIVGSCNGLVCILVEDNNTLFIYNPSTRITNFLLGSKKGAVSFSVHGFGYDEMTHDYKVVKLYQTWPCWGTMIYSLKARSWKEIGLFPCPDHLSDGKFLNGALHWATGDGQSGNIVSLDLGKETYGEVLQPEYDEGSGYFELEVSGEWLCVLCDYYENRAVDVWVMKVYGVKDSWTKLASIRHPNIWGAQIFLASF